MLTPSALDQEFGQQFTTTILVSTSSTSIDPGTGLPVTIDIPSTTIPIVTADPVDPGVTIAVSTGTVILSGAYQTIIPITWHWLDLTGQAQTGRSKPEVGTYTKIIEVESPSFLQRACTYTIDSETFVHTVFLNSYTPIRDALLSSLAGQPGD